VLKVDRTACVDVDVTCGGQGGRIDGVVLAPVFRADNSYFVN
jgi:hypothetical protein